MPAAVDSAFDVALWFLDRALDDREYLQPQKLQRLIYLAQAYYAVAYAGRKLMPAVFVADDFGPLEPTLFRALEQGRPLSLEPRPMPPSVEDFLDSIWRRFGSHSADHLSRQLKAHPPYRDAWEKAPRAEITLDAMRAFYGARASARQGAPEIDNVLRPKVMRSHTGRPVSVSKWMPPAKPSPKAKG